jgi:hypothetical protein
MPDPVQAAIEYVEPAIPIRSQSRGAVAAEVPVPCGGFRWRDDLRSVSPLMLDDAWRDRQDGAGVRLGLEIGRPGWGVEDPGPWLTPQGRFGLDDSAVWTAPLAKRALHRRFAGLAPTPKAILRFADVFGFLGHGGRRLVPRSGGGEVRGESLAFWRRQIEQLRVLLRLWDWVCLEDAGELGAFFRWTPRRPRVEFCLPYAGRGLQAALARRYWARRDAGGTGWPDEPQWAIEGVIESEGGEGRWRRGDLIEPTRTFIHHTVNTTLAGHGCPVVPVEPRGQIWIVPDCLRAALYILFALELKGGPGLPERVCPRPGCDRYFTPSHGLQRYCSDACRKLAHYHRHKEGDEPMAKQRRRTRVQKRGGQ